MPLISRLLLPAALLALALPGVAAAAPKTYEVASSADFTSAAAAAATGDTLHVHPGVYQATIAVANPGVTIAADQGSILLNPTAGTQPTLSFASAAAGSPDVLTGLDVLNTVTGGAAAVVAGGSGLTMQRALALSTKGDALSSTATTGAGARTIIVDSSMLFAAAGSALHATTSGVGIGTTTVAGHHVTAVALNSVTLDSSGAQGVVLAAPPGNIAASFSDSILLGKQVTMQNSSAGIGNTAGPITGSRNRTANDASQAASIFAAPARGNYHLRADSPAVGQGLFTPGESATDIDGDAVASSGATDQGADQFVNHAPTAVLAPVTGTVRQNQPVGFDASQSSDPEAGIGGGIAAYHWDFGDGTTATTPGPTTTHAYSVKQAYSVTVAVTDKQGAGSTPSAADTFTVLDGVPPHLVVAKPTAKQRITLYKSRKGKHGKITHTTIRLPISFLGSAQDDVAISKVVLALRPVATSGGACRWFDGISKLKATLCSTPVLLTPTLINGGWRYTLPTKAKLSRGAYDLYAYAVDSSGLPSAITIIAFRFV